MKPLAGIFWLGACLASFAQGTVNFLNTSGTAIRTNAKALGATAGRTTPIANSFYYALLTAPSTVTSLDQDAQNLLTPTWTFTGLYATNTTVATGGRFTGGSGVFANGWDRSADTQPWIFTQVPQLLLAGDSSTVLPLA